MFAKAVIPRTHFVEIFRAKMVLSMRTCNYQAFERNSSVRLFFKTNPTHCRKVREKKFFIQSNKRKHIFIQLEAVYNNN